MSGTLPDRRLAAIMFTDISGFTTLAQRDERVALEVLESQRALVRPILARHRGREVKTIGDAFLVEFPSALEAVECASEVQSTLKSANSQLPDDRRMNVRIGIHLGDVIHDGTDVAGDAVNVASRIEPLALPGGVCVTSQVRDSVVNKVPFTFEPMGRVSLKNVAEPVAVYRLAGYGRELKQPQKPPNDRVAILPFANISPDRSDEFIADGLTEELISLASRAGGLRVIARTSVMQYKGTSKRVSDIGKELNVGSVLEGSVRRAGDRLRVAVQLVGTDDEVPRWSQEYDRELRDVFEVQRDVGRKVAEALKTEFMGRESPGTKEPQAHLLYLRGRQAWNLRTADGLGRSVEFYSKALEADPEYAMAYAGMADSYAALALLELVPPAEAFPKAKEAVGRALELHPRLPEALTSLGLALFQYEWDWRGAEEALRTAIEEAPSYAPARHSYADFLKAMGRFTEALDQIQRARELDPLNLTINTGVGHVLYLAGRYDEAIEQYKRAVELDPGFTLTHIWFGRPYLEKGMFQEAIAELETAVRLSGRSTLALAMLGHGLASAGRTDDAQKILEELGEREKSSYVPSYWMAVVFNGFRDREETIYWMSKALMERSSWLVWANVEPRFAWLRRDPEFAAILAEMRFPSSTVK